MTTAAPDRSRRLRKPAPAAEPQVVDGAPEPAAPDAKAAPREILRNETTGRAIPQTVKTESLAIDEHGIAMRRALLRSWWMFMFWLVGPLFTGATFQVIPGPGPHLLINLVCLLIPVPLFLVYWGRQFMPVLRLELNEQGDRYQMRVLYALKADHGAEGRMQIFGARGYAVDGLEKEDRALDPSNVSPQHQTTTPEGLRYLCDHTPSEERYRRKNSTIARDVIQWGAVTLLVGILVGVTFLIGNIILTENAATSG